MGMFGYAGAAKPRIYKCRQNQRWYCGEKDRFFSTFTGVGNSPQEAWNKWAIKQHRWQRSIQRY